MLYLVKDPVAQGNSIHVCFIPKAKANRTVNSKLKNLAVDSTGFPTQYVDTAASDFSGGYPNSATWSFTSPSTSLFKCVP